MLVMKLVSYHTVNARYEHYRENWTSIQTILKDFVTFIYFVKSQYRMTFVGKCDIKIR